MTDPVEAQGTPPLPNHPEPRTMRWTALELAAIQAYGDARAAAERERCAKAPADIKARLDPVYAALKDGDCLGAALAMDRVLSWIDSAIRATTQEGKQP